MQTSMHFYGWKKGLKTGMYYLRTRPAAQAIQFTVDKAAVKAAEGETVPPAAPVPFAEKSATPPVASPPPPSNVNGRGSEPPASPTHSHYASPASQPVKGEDPEPLSLDGSASKAAEDPEYAAALERLRQRQLAEEKLMCSLENKDACKQGMDAGERTE